MTILIVLPILTLLMFELGLNLRLKDFALILKRPKAVLIGLLGQLVILPAVAIYIVSYLNLPEVLLLGLILIACCPGGSSSNIFSLLCGGDVALSVSLTTISTVISIFTLPFAVNFALDFAKLSEANFELPVLKLLMQNFVLMIVPISLGLILKALRENLAKRIHLFLSKIAFPCLVLLASVFFIEHRTDILDNFENLGLAVTALIILSISVSSILSRVVHLRSEERRTIVVEVGMQNAAMAIAIAASPLIFNNPTLAIPAIIYALLMNIILLIYVAVYRYYFGFGLKTA